MNENIFLHVDYDNGNTYTVNLKYIVEALRIKRENGMECMLIFSNGERARWVNPKVFNTIMDVMLSGERVYRTEAKAEEE